MNNAKATDAAAASWFARRDSGGWQQHDQAEFDAWLDSSLANRLAFIRVETAWERARRLRALRRSSARGAVPPVGEWQLPADAGVNTAGHASSSSENSRTYFARLGRTYGIAAGLALAVALLASWLVFVSHTPAYRTAVGHTETVSLQDGSKVILNTNSKMRVELTSTQRAVSVDGEAFFEVAKDPLRPFFVDVGAERVTAVGTRFSVRLEDGKVRVAVTEGQVRIESREARNQPSRLLGPGDVAQMDRDDLTVQKKPVAQVETEDLGWRKGYVWFRDTSIGEVVRELNRYEVRKLRVADPAVAAIRIGGEFRISNVDAFVRLIQQDVPVHPVQHSDEIVLEDD